MSNTVRQYLIDQKLHTASDDTYSHIDEWLDWYKGDVEKFHTYTIWNGVVATVQKRYRLGMAKKICEDWANLLLNEKVAIKAGDYEKRLNEILEKNNFRVRGNQLVEMAFALGTGAFVEYLDSDGEVLIDYIRADMIYPLSWDNGDITECAFGSTRVVDGKEKSIFRYTEKAERSRKRARRREKTRIHTTSKTSTLMRSPGRRKRSRRAWKSWLTRNMTGPFSR